jgi:hypothetical protein
MLQVPLKPAGTVPRMSTLRGLEGVYGATVNHVQVCAAVGTHVSTSPALSSIAEPLQEIMPPGPVGGFEQFGDVIRGATFAAPAACVTVMSKKLPPNEMRTVPVRSAPVLLARFTDVWPEPLNGPGETTVMKLEGVDADHDAQVVGVSGGCAVTVIGTLKVVAEALKFSDVAVA